MITLEEYKEYLVNFYRVEYDNTPEKKKERREELARTYSDDMLNKVISDTYDFVEEIFNSNVQEKDCYLLKLKDDWSTDMNLRIVGGWSQDILYNDLNGRTISHYILQNTFKKSKVWMKEEIREFNDEEDLEIIGFDYDYYLQIQKFPENMKEIKENLFGKGKQLLI